MRYLILLLVPITSWVSLSAKEAKRQSIEFQWRNVKNCTSNLISELDGGIADSIEDGQFQTGVYVSNSCQIAQVYSDVRKHFDDRGYKTNIVILEKDLGTSKRRIEVKWE